MKDSSIRIDWRDSPEQTAATIALKRAYRARRTLYFALALAGIAALLLLRDDSLCLVSIALGCVALAVGRLYWSQRARIERAHLRAWIAAARARRTDAFREPASEKDARDGDLPMFVRIDADGVQWGWRTSELRLRWAAIGGIHSFGDGHVMFRGRLQTDGVLVPAWAFEADEHRATFLEHAQSLRRGADPHPPAPEEAPPLEPGSDHEITIAVPRTARSLYAQMRATGMTISQRAFIAVLALWALGIGYVIVPPVWRAVVPPIVGYPLALALAVSITSSWFRVLLALPVVRAHRVTRARFSELGLSFASALSSSIHRWRDVQLERLPSATILAGFIVLDDWLKPEEVAVLETWKMAAAPPQPVAPPAEAPTSSWRPLVWGLVAIAVCIAIYQLVTTTSERAQSQLFDPPAMTGRVACALGERVVPGAPLADDVAACAGLADVLRDTQATDPAGIQHCVAIDDRTLDAAAIVWRSTGVDLWLRVERDWKNAGPLVRWPERDDPYCAQIAVSAIQLRAGGSPELLVSMDCETNRVIGVEARRRQLSACGVVDGAPHCWWTILTAESERSPAGDACHRWSYSVTSLSHYRSPGGGLAGPVYPERASEDRLLLVRAEGDAPAGSAPPGEYGVDDLVAYGLIRAD